MEEVKAEVMEGSLSVTFLPAEITANFKALDERVEGLLELYKGTVIDISDPNAVKNASKDCTYLNGVAKEIDERRKAIKREFNKPLAEFEAQANAIRDKVLSVRSEIKEQVDEAEQRAKDAKEAHLMDFYADLAPVLVPVVPYARIADPKWLNKSTNIKKAEDELTAKVQKIAQDWETFKSMGLEFHEQAEVEFFRTLDLGASVTLNQTLKEERERIEAMKAEMEPDPEPVQPVPEPVQPVQQITAPVQEQVQHAPMNVQPAPVQPEPVKTYTMQFTATRSDAQRIADFCKSIGVRGKICAN